MRNDCQIGPRGRCCCNCRYRLIDFHHCTTAPELRGGHGGCVCGLPKGFICAPPLGVRVHSGWSEHGLCEMHGFAKQRLTDA